MNVTAALKILQNLRVSLDELDQVYENVAGDSERPLLLGFNDELRAHCDAFKQRVESFIPRIFDGDSNICENYIFKLRLIQFYARSNYGVLYDRFAGGKAASHQLLKLMQDEVEFLYAEQDALSETDAVRQAETILPNDLCSETRGYIESLAKQINATYESNVFDGCAVLMRRLLEILLILAYRYLAIEDVIKTTPDKYMTLEQIIVNAKSNTQLSLSKDTKSILDDFRKLGNFSAHKIEYNCRRSDISRIQREYRATIEELLYKSGMKK